MRTILIAGLALASLSTQANAETRSLTGFDEVHVAGRYRADVAVGPTFSVTIEGADAARIRTRIEGDTLKIEPVSRPWFGNPRYDVVVHVTAPRLAGVTASRGATVSAIGGGACTDFNAVAAMGAELSVRDLQCDRVDATAAMGAELNLAGSCGALDATAAMGAEVNADALRCRTVDANASMGADVDAYASSTFDASASMGGDISVAGGGHGQRSATMGGSVSAN